MKTRQRELAKPGIYGSEDNPQVVTVDDLKQIAETFPEITKAPIQLGHWGDPARPRLGNVTAVTWDDKTQTLLGTLEEQDALAQAVDEGFYPDVSIASKRRASDGKMYLLHAAYLGEEAPAVKDLVAQVSQSLDPNDTPDIAASDAKGATIIPAIGTRLLVLADPAKKATQQNPKEGKPMTIEEALAAKKAAEAKALALSDQLTQANTTVKSQKEKLDSLAAKYPEEELLLSDSADPRVSTLTAQLKQGKRNNLLAAAAGKVPKAKLPLLETLAGTFGMSESIELSDGTTKEKVDAFTLTTRILESIPAPVTPGHLSLSDVQAGDKTPVSARELLKNF